MYICSYAKSDRNEGYCQIEYIAGALDYSWYISYKYINYNIIKPLLRGVLTVEEVYMIMIGDL